MAEAGGMEAIVLRTLRYGEADLIAHVLTRTAGRRGVIAKGARRPRSRLGARLEPFLVVDLQLVEGRGDLATVRGVEVSAAHDGLRSSWRAQETGAAALDLVSRITIEHQPVEPAYHLLGNFLGLLDSATTLGDADGGRAETLLAAFQLKLLHAVGIAPELGACVRCGDDVALVAFSAPDGGTVCSRCRTAGDRPLDPVVHASAVQLMRDPLAAVAARAVDELPTTRTLATITKDVVGATCREHAGVNLRRRD